MIVNSNINHGQLESNHYDGYYLKRKLDNTILPSDSSECEQSKKRQLKSLEITTNNLNTIYDNNGYTNISNNIYNIDCQNIEFLHYETPLTPVEVVQRSNFTDEQYDTNWNGSDLLDLGQKYTTAMTNTDCMERQNSPQQHNIQQTDPDFEDRNLSWLFNFKLNELPHLSPEVNRNHQQQPDSPSKYKNGKTQSQLGRKVDEIIMETTADIDDNEIIVAENVVVDNTPKTPKKPPFTYTELIEYALEDKRELTVSGIYQWISDRFPFYKSNDDRWKNSVRHNLSINPHFRKGAKAPQGAGHLWTISSRDSEENILAWEHKKQRLELFFKMESSLKNRTSSTNEQYDETAQAAASIAQQMQNENTGPEEVVCMNDVGVCNSDGHITIDMMQQDDLKKTAAEILNGVRRNVEVQPVNPVTNFTQNSLETDYLNPVSKDDIVIESGLRSSQNRSCHGDDYYVAEIDPIELGIHMSNVEEEVLFSDEFNLNYFGITPGNDIMA